MPRHTPPPVASVAEPLAQPNAGPARSDLPGPTLRSLCPVANSLDVIGDRWTLLVIRDLVLGKWRFSDFLTSPEHIPTNILAERLKRLERAGLIEAVPYSERPPRFAYHLTAAGRTLGPVIDAIADWGLVHFPGTRRARPNQSPGEVPRAAED